jgi:hypothetical protein
MQKIPCSCSWTGGSREADVREGVVRDVPVKSAPDKKGVSKMTFGSRPTVSIVVTKTGAEHTDVAIDLSPADARTMAARLNELADRVDQSTTSAGVE